MRWGQAFLAAFLIGAPALASEERISAVKVSGTSRIEGAAVLERVSLKPGSQLDRAVLKENVKAVFGMGYFRDVRARFDAESGTLTFDVEEKTVVRNVSFRGNQREKAEDLVKEIRTTAFSYADENRIRQDVERLRQYYDQRGYYLTDIRPELTALPNNEAELTYVIEEHHKVKVRSISFIGNRVFSDGELRGVIQTKEKGFLSFLTGSGAYHKAASDADRQFLQSHYGHHGYIKAKLGAPRVRLSKDKRSLSITFTVEEGEKYRVGDVSVSGNLLHPAEDVRKKIRLKSTEVVDTHLIQQDMAALSLFYMDDGYAYVNVIPQDRYDDDRRIVDIDYFVEPGQLVRIERIEFRGHDSTRDKVLRREIPIVEGEIYSHSKIQQGRANIERLAIYEEIKVSTPRGSADDRVGVIVEIKEKSTGTFSIGAGFNTFEKFQFQGQVQKRNLFGYGVDVSLSAILGGKTQSFNLQYRDEYFLDTRFGLVANAFSIGRRYSNFDLTSRGGNIGFDYPLYRKGLERIRAGLKYSLVNQDLSDIRPTVEKLFRGGVTSSVTASVSRDTRNRVFEPTRGTLLGITEEVAGGPFGGGNSFTKTEFDARWFFPVAENRSIPMIGNSVLAFHLEVGFVAPLKDGERVPIFERYFPGGILSLRGFPLRSLGPKIRVASSSDPGGFTTTDFAVGGNKQIIFNAEYLFPIVSVANIRGVFFFDMGNAFDNGESLFTITGQRQSVGFGIRWFSPIGPLRFEWGFPLDRKDDEGLVQFDFTIGSLF